MYKDSVFDCVRPDWTEAREIAVFTGMKRKRRRRTAVRVSALTVLFIGLIGTLLWGIGRFGEEETAGGAEAVMPAKLAATPARTEREPLQLNDGSSAYPMDEHSRIVIEKQTENRVALRLATGSGRFDVVPNRARVFEVLVDDIVVSVLGTRFDVKQAENGAEITVHEGHVRVSWSDGEAELRTGESGLFPPEEGSPSLTENDTTPSLRVKRRGGSRSRHSSWRSLAESGDYSGASTLLTEGAEVKDRVKDLLLAADAMRLSKKPVEALPYLERISKDHPSDPLAPLAAFTRGRILMNQLGRPKAAAAAFAEAGRLSPKGALAEDALAREVEALSKAGDEEGARARAKRYRAAYPKGRRLGEVRRFGHLD